MPIPTPAATSPFQRLAFAVGLACATAALPAAAAQPLKPFSADYQASYMGLQGNAKMTLESQGNNQWKYSLDIGSNGIQLNQDTVFEDRDGAWRPLSNRTSSLLLIKKSDKSATYDWSKGVATWSGDVKPDRAGPVQLQPGDVDGLLLNLMIARDVNAGKPLNYRLVDAGRAKQLSYKVQGKEAITVDGKQKQATKVVQTDGDKQIVVWVVDGLPAPARILQRKDGKDDIDLRIKSTH